MSLTDKLCPSCNVPLMKGREMFWVCPQCGETFVPPGISIKETHTRCDRGVSDITRKTLERIVEQEGVQIILLYNDDAAVVFRGNNIETMIPPNVHESGPAGIPQTVRNVLLTLALFQNPALLDTAQEMLREANKILKQGEENADEKGKGDPEGSG